MLEQFRIAQFHPDDQAVVKDLILDGLQEHWGTVDDEKNPDLNDIAASYAEGIFFVARLNERIVGTGALLPIDSHACEIKRMSVAADLRRHGVGRLVLQELIECAKRQSFQRIILETTSTWQDAVAFYVGNGFRITHHQEGDTYFLLELHP